LAPPGQRGARHRPDHHQGPAQAPVSPEVRRKAHHRPLLVSDCAILPIRSERMTVALVIGLAVTLVFVGTFGMATTIRNIELSKAMQLIRERMFAARL